MKNKYLTNAGQPGWLNVSVNYIVIKKARWVCVCVGGGGGGNYGKELLPRG